MKKLIVALMVLTSLVSCGKNNSVASLGITSVTNPIITNNAMAQSLVSMIANPSTGFGQGLVSTGSSNQTTGTTWNALLVSNPNIVYQYSTGRTVRNVDVVIVTKQNELVGILNSATSVQVSGSLYYINVAGSQYVIDIRYPLQLNPSAKSDQTGSEYFVQAM